MKKQACPRNRYFISFSVFGPLPETIRFCVGRSIPAEGTERAFTDEFLEDLLGRMLFFWNQLCSGPQLEGLQFFCFPRLEKK